MTLARAGRAEEDGVFGSPEEAPRGELEDQGAIGLRVELEVEAIERLVGIAEASLLDAPGEQPVLSALEFVLDERRQQVDGRPLALLGFEQAHLQMLRHAREPELAQSGVEFSQIHGRSPRCGDRSDRGSG